MKALIKTIIYQPLYNALIFLVWLIPGHSVGWAIIILTTIVRLALLPSSLKANRSQIKLRELQPELTKIQEKFKDDKQAQSQAIMAFYKKHKVSPWGSCLPLLIQLPILLALYYVFINGLSTAHFDLLYGFTPRPDSINPMFFGLDLTKPDKYVLPILAGISQFIQGWQMQGSMATKKTSDGKPDMQGALSKQMMFVMPIFTVIIAMRLPAALPIYWIITTLFGIGQWWWAQKTIPKSEIEEEIEKVEKEFHLTSVNKKETVSKKTKKGVEITVRRRK